MLREEDNLDGFEGAETGGGENGTNGTNGHRSEQYGREQPPPIPLLDEDDCEEINLGGETVASKLRLDTNILSNNDSSVPFVDPLQSIIADSNKWESVSLADDAPPNLKGVSHDASRPSDAVDGVASLTMKTSHFCCMTTALPRIRPDDVTPPYVKSTEYSIVNGTAGFYNPDADITHTGKSVTPPPTEDNSKAANRQFSSPLVSSIGDSSNTASISPPLEEPNKTSEAAKVVISPFGADTESEEKKMASNSRAGTSNSEPATVTATASSSRAALSPIQEQANYTMNVSITEFEKRGDGMNAYIVYKLVCIVAGVQGYQDRTYEVWRRFSDFLGLHDKLIEKYLSKGVVVPPTPEKSISAMTKTKTTSDPNLSRDVAVRRCRQLERFIRRVVQHPRMRVDCDVRDFLTLEAELPKAINTSALSSAGVKRMFKTVGEVFNKMAFHMEEGDRWFEQALSHIDELDEALRRLLSLAEKMAGDRKELAHSGEMLSKGLSMLASCEESTALSRALSHLTETEENVAVLWERQSEADTVVFVEAVQEYVGLIGSLRDVFDERVRVWQQWQTAQQNLAKKREQKAKLELSGRNDRVAQVRDEIDEAVRKMDALEAEFGELSKLIREEVARFESQRRADMKKIIISYLESLLKTHQEILKLWEKFEPETHAIIV